jgi:hypothetical protein
MGENLWAGLLNARLAIAIAIPKLHQLLFAMFDLAVKTA